MTKQELKKIRCAALESEYGFAPAYKNITLLESYDNGEYILFSVKGNVYNFSSYRQGSNGVYVGKGSIIRE